MVVLFFKCVVVFQCLRVHVAHEGRRDCRGFQRRALQRRCRLFLDLTRRISEAMSLSVHGVANAPAHAAAHSRPGFARSRAPLAHALSVRPLFGVFDLALALEQHLLVRTLADAKMHADGNEPDQGADQRKQRVVKAGPVERAVRRR